MAEGENNRRAAPNDRKDVFQCRMQILFGGLWWLSECCRVVWIQSDRTADIGWRISGSSISNGQALLLGGSMFFEPSEMHHN